MSILKTALVMMFLVMAAGAHLASAAGPGVGKYDKRCTDACDSCGNKYKSSYDTHLGYCVKDYKDNLLAHGKQVTKSDADIAERHCPAQWKKVTNNKANWHTCYERCKGGANGYCVGYGCVRSCIATQANNWTCPGDDKYPAEPRWC